MPLVSGKCMTRLLTFSSESSLPFALAPFVETAGAGAATFEAGPEVDVVIVGLPLDCVRIEIRWGGREEWIVRIERPVSPRQHRLESKVRVARRKRMAVLHGDQILIVLFADLFPEPTRRP